MVKCLQLLVLAVEVLNASPADDAETRFRCGRNAFLVYIFAIDASLTLQIDSLVCWHAAADTLF